MQNTLLTGDDRIEIGGATDPVAINGVMPSLGRVLVPESLDGFAGLKN